MCIRQFVRITVRIAVVCAVFVLFSCHPASAQEATLQQLKGSAGELKAKETFLGRSIVYGQISDEMQNIGLNTGFFAAGQSTTFLYAIGCNAPDLNTNSRFIPDKIKQALSALMNHIPHFSPKSVAFFTTLSPKIAALNASVVIECAGSGKLSVDGTTYSDPTLFDAAMVHREQSLVEAELQKLAPADQQTVVEETDNIMKACNKVYALRFYFFPLLAKPDSPILRGNLTAYSSACCMTWAKLNGKEITFAEQRDREMIGTTAAFLGKNSDVIAFVRPGSGWVNTDLQLEVGDTIHVESIGAIRGKDGMVSGPDGNADPSWLPLVGNSPDSVPVGASVFAIKSILPAEPTFYPIGKSRDLVGVSGKPGGILLLRCNVTNVREGFFLLSLYRTHTSSSGN